VENGWEMIDEEERVSAMLLRRAPISRWFVLTCKKHGESENLSFPV